MPIVKIAIKLSNGQRYRLRLPDTLQEIDDKRTALFVFDDATIYEGWSDGKVDAEGFFCIHKDGLDWGLGLPFGRLVGWAYKRRERR